MDLKCESDDEFARDHLSEGTANTTDPDDVLGFKLNHGNALNSSVWHEFAVVLECTLSTDLRIDLMTTEIACRSSLSGLMTFSKLTGEVDTAISQRLVSPLLQARPTIHH